MHLSSEALAGYLDRDLAGQEQNQAELHLASCPECRQELAEIRRLQLRRRRRKMALVLAPAAAAAAVLLTTTLSRQGLRLRSMADRSRSSGGAPAREPPTP